MPVVLGAVIALVVGLGAGVAYGYFTGSGAGSGVAITGGDPPVTVIEASGTVTSELYPGASADLLVELDNPNNFSVDIVTITGNGTVTGSGGIGTCTSTGVTVPTQTGLSIPVAPGDNVVVHIPNGVTMGASSSSGCQGATFQAPIMITVEKE
jgi:hypothetical protein